MLTVPAFLHPNWLLSSQKEGKHLARFHQFVMKVYLASC